MIDTTTIKNLRDKTGVSVMDCKRALEESNGDEKGAMELLKKRGIEVAEKKSERGTKAGIVDAYIHSTNQVGVLLELRVETDFVAKNPLFKELAHNLSMHIAAMKPANVEELMSQPYIKNPGLTMSEFIKEHIQKFGENIEVARFERFSLQD